MRSVKNQPRRVPKFIRIMPINDVFWGRFGKLVAFIVALTRDLAFSLEKRHFFAFFSFHEKAPALRPGLFVELLQRLEC
jgi:hypothetical protein